MSVKKKPAARVEGKTADGPQSAAARRAAEAELRTLIDRFAPTQLRLVAAMRKALRKRLPAAHEIVYEYRDCFVVSLSPDDRGYEGALAIRGSADGIRLYFNRGKDLSDPEKMLHGSSQTRWIPVPTAAALARPEVARLIEEAIARNRVPFAATGGGSVVMSPSTSAKRRRPAERK
jgi:hypothetical protein